VTVRRIVVALVAAACAWSVLGLAGVSIAADPFHPDTTRITADFPRTVGLYAHSRVRVQGIDSGWVTKVDPRIDGVTVTMEVHDVALAANATAELRLKSMIGERYVELDPVWTGTGPKLHDGAHLERDRVHVPAEISEVLDQFTHLAERVDSKAVGSFVHQLAIAVDGRQADLAKVITNFAATGRTVSARATEMDRSIAALQGVMGTLAGKDDRMVELLQSAAAVSDALLAQDGALDASITSIDKLLDQVDTLTTTQKDKLVALVNGLGRVGTVLAKHDRDFGSVVDLLPSVAYGYQRAVDHDGDRWYTVNYPEGILFLPSMPPVNGGGGPGSDRGDHTFIPYIDHSGSVYGRAVPQRVDGSQWTGDGPLVPGFSIGPDGDSVCHDSGCDR
jgi:virulence factor Mce-like protein